MNERKTTYVFSEGKSGNVETLIEIDQATTVSERQEDGHAHA